MPKSKATLLKSLGNKPRTGVIKICPICNTEFYVKPSDIKKRHYCSYPCMAKGYTNSLDLVCVICGKNYTRPVSQVKWRGSSTCSKECAGKYTSLRQKGENNPAWNGGISRYYKFGYHSKKYKEWRKKVFEKDNYTCQNCGDRTGNGKAVYFEPHHIFRFSFFDKFRFTIANGVTLCKKCHNETKKFDKISRLVMI